MKRILWLSNHRFSTNASVATGTWLGAMGSRLVDSGAVNLANVTCDWVSEIEHEKINGVEQWVLPKKWKVGDNGLPSAENVANICAIVEEYRPDIVHAWGLENYFGLLIAEKLLGPVKTLIDIQGIRHAIAQYYMGGLTHKEQRQCLGLKEILRPSSSVFRCRDWFANDETRELGIIAGCTNISYQSEWTHGHLMSINPSARLFKTARMMRREFCEAAPWRWHSDRAESRIFAVCGNSVPYKGLHVLLRAAAALKRFCATGDKVVVRVAGGLGGTGIRRGGYSKWIDRQIDMLGLAANVQFLGPIPANDIVDEMHKADVFVHPSFIESYSLAVAEAMAVGIPSVVSYAGAMPELAEDGVSALYYPPGDAVSCARRINEILMSRSLAEQLSRSAIEKSKGRNSPEFVLGRQLEIYDAI